RTLIRKGGRNERTKKRRRICARSGALSRRLWAAQCVRRFLASWLRCKSLVAGPAAARAVSFEWDYGDRVASTVDFRTATAAVAHRAMGDLDFGRLACAGGPGQCGELLRF